MAKESIHVVDFDLFNETVKSLSKFAESAKFMISDTGLTVYSKNSVARCELTSNSVNADKPLEFNIIDLSMFVKVLGTIKEVHTGDYSTLKLFIQDNKFLVESRKFKTKLMLTDKNELIEKWVSQKLTTPLTPVCEFTTSSDLIRRLNSHSYIFSNTESLRLYLMIDNDLEKNALYCTLGNDSNDLNNSMTLKLGLITSGSLNDRKLVLDFERINLFNLIQSPNIKIQLMDKNCLVSHVKISGKRNSISNFTIYNSLRKS